MVFAHNLGKVNIGFVNANDEAFCPDVARSIEPFVILLDGTNPRLKYAPEYPQVRPCAAGFFALLVHDDVTA